MYPVPGFGTSSVEISYSTIKVLGCIHDIIEKGPKIQGIWISLNNYISQ